MMEAPSISAKFVLFEALLLLTYFYACEGIIEGDVFLEHQPGDGPRNGVVKVFLDEEWQPISSKGFDEATASVICHSAGFPRVGIPHGGVYYLPGPPTWRVTCTGSEDTLMECSRVLAENSLIDVSVSYSLTHMSDNYEAAYVECNEMMALTGTNEIFLLLVVSCLVVLVAVVIVACFLHRCDLRRKMSKLTLAQAKKEQGVIEMEYAELDRREKALPSDQPSKSASSFITEPKVKDEVNEGDATYSSNVYNETNESSEYEKPELLEEKPAENTYATCQ